jgi:hypothetical protein
LEEAGRFFSVSTNAFHAWERGRAAPKDVKAARQKMAARPAPKPTVPDADPERDLHLKQVVDRVGRNRNLVVARLNSGRLKGHKVDGTLAGHRERGEVKVPAGSLAPPNGPGSFGGPGRPV